VAPGRSFSTPRVTLGRRALMPAVKEASKKVVFLALQCLRRTFLANRNPFGRDHTSFRFTPGRHTDSPETTSAWTLQGNF
jgi:hypothetical protein